MHVFPFYQIASRTHPW